MVFILPVSAFTQQNPNTKQQKFQLTFKDTLISTGDRFIIQYSEKLIIETTQLESLIDYNFDFRNGNIRISESLFAKYSLDTNRIYDLIVEYDIFPYSIREEYTNFDLKIERDTLTGDTITYAVQTTDVIENIFEGTDLEKSGNLFRGFTVGTNRDISLNSGFKLQLNGKLSKDIDIVAALSDENLQIQPEGNTQKLQELDRVFIEIKSKNLGATIGDIDVNLNTSDFLKFSRKIQGAKGYGDYGAGNFLLSGAVSRGKFASNSFAGIDGVQGPYRLVGNDNEINIIVLSGTEKVYVDGILMTRGDQADYIIDYALGQITFTNKKLITNASRIIVDFEYSDRKYSRTLIAANNKFELMEKKLSIDLSYLNETDNENKTIDFNLSDSDRVILKNAGNEKYKSVKSGVIYAGRDSLNFPLGSYVRVDTVINSNIYTFYRFAPNDTDAVYNVTFSYVGQGSGDYRSLSTIEYEFTGINGGAYAPVIFIPVPTSYQIAGLSLNFSPDRKGDLSIKIESAYSLFDRNKFSDIGDNKGGVAFNGEIGFKKSDFKFAGVNFDNFLAGYKQRVINKTFSSLDRINPVEFNRNYDLNDSTNATEDLREAYLTLSASKLVRLQGNFSQLRKGDFFSSLRATGTFEFNTTEMEKYKEIPKLRYTIERIGSNNSSQKTDGRWFKHNALLSYRKYFGKNESQRFLDFLFEFTGENRKSSIEGTSGDSLRAESFAFNEFKPKLVLNNIYDVTLYAEYNYRIDDNTNNGSFYNLSNSLAQRYGASYSGTSWLYVNFDLSIFDRYYSDLGKQFGNADNKTVLVNSRARISPLNSAIVTDLLYTVSSERTAKIEKLFVLVPVGQGNYIYLGDLNSNGIQDENEFQPVNFDGNYIKLNVPTDQFFPTVDLRTSVRLNFKPSRQWMVNSRGILANVYNNFSTETSYRIDEKSKDPVTSNLYFLKLNTLLNDSNTLAGAQLLQQDINFFENNPQYSFRFRYLQIRGLNQFSSGNERYLNVTRSYRMRLGLTSDITTQAEFFIKTDRNIAPVASIRNRNISSYQINTDLAYRPIQIIESGLQLNFIKATDYYPEIYNDASINQQILRFNYSLTSTGRLRIELERDEVLLSSDAVSFPYELTSGKPSGKSYYWRAFFDYNITRNIQVNLNYDGRSESKSRVIHTGRAQVTAFF